MRDEEDPPGPVKSVKSSRTIAVLLAAAVVATVAAIGLYVALPPRHGNAPAPPSEPYGPIRSISAVRHDAHTLTGQFVRMRGRIAAIQDLNPGMPFPWDVVYTLDDGSSTVPIHWFTQERRPKELKPPSLPDGTVIVTGKVKRDLELGGKTYPLILHEQAELHNQAHPTLPTSPALR